MNIARINLSHGAWEQHLGVIRTVKALNAKLAKQGKPPTSVAIMLDTQGAEVRTGVVEVPMSIKANEEVIFSFKPLKKEKKQVIAVNHKLFHLDAKDAETILLDNGKMSFSIVSIRKDHAVVAKAHEAGKIGSRRHVNLPGANLHMPSLSKKDWEDLAAGAKEGIDAVALSFIRTSAEVDEVRAFFKKRGKENIQLIAKIETPLGVKNIEEIVEASDGVMVARGDLGAEVPFEKIPVIQEDIVHLCRAAGKHVIVATHMLESMIENPMPTRAEVTDIAYAAAMATDMTMLSGETASGAHPVAALSAMDRVLRETEKHLMESGRHHTEMIRSERDAQAESAVLLALSSSARAIVVMTKSGQTARDLSRFRPFMPIIALCPDASVQRSLQFHFGVVPLVISFKKDPEQTVSAALALAKKSGMLKKGDKFVLVSDAKAHPQNVSAIEVRQLS
jgi:pyruvate kinase